VVDYHRKGKPESIDPINQPKSIRNPEGSIEDTVIGRLNSKILAKALEKLEDTAQNVIILRFLNGLSHAQTAEVLDLNEGHVRLIQYRALKQLRRIFDEENCV
jgi:RNA polymerase sigma-70 factor (ECF subfamily)